MASLIHYHKKKLDLDLLVKAYRHYLHQKLRNESIFLDKQVNPMIQQLSSLRSDEYFWSENDDAINYPLLSHMSSSRIYFCCYRSMKAPINPKMETLKLSILFFILFTATNSVLTIITYIYEQADLAIIGPTNIAVSYLTFIFSTIYAPSCKWKIKNQMLVATIAYTINFSTGLLVPFASLPFKFVLTVGGSAICGLSAGLLWVSQGRYIHITCENAGIRHEKGDHFGLFSLLYCLSHISAGLITTFGLGLFSPYIYFICITLTGVLAVLFCWFFIQDVEVEQISQQQNPEQNQSLAQVFRYYPKMFSILCILIIDGLCYGIHMSEITHMIPIDTPDDMMNLYAGYCNISLGVGASLGGYISGKVGDKIGSRRSGALGIGFFLIGCLLAYLTILLQNFTLTLASALVWGFFLFYIEGWLYIVCSREFKGRSESFSVNKQLGSITCFLFQLIVLFTGNRLNLEIIFPVIAILAIPAFISLFKLPTSETERNTLQESTIETRLTQQS